MVGALIILLVTVAVGLLLYVYDLKYRRKESQMKDREQGETTAETSTVDHGELCCGQHLICDKPLTPVPGEKPVYYDDEELDRFAYRGPDDYNDDEIEEVRDVMMTLLPEDVPGWVRSLQLRGIHVPTPLRDELILLLTTEV